MRKVRANLAVMALAMTVGSVHLMAANTSAMLRSNGGVSVNGNPAPSVTTVFSGDRIETAPKAAGNLSVSGSSVMVDENSSLTFAGQDIDFACGGGTVKTYRGLAARYGRLTVKPATDAARFQVQQSGTSVKVSALEGTLSVFDGAKNVELPVGQSLTMAYSGCAQMARNQDQTVASSNPPAPPQSADPAPPMAGGTVPGNLTKAIILGPVSVTTVGVAALIAVSQQPVSPSHP